MTDIQNLLFTVRNKASYIPWATRKAVTGKGEDTNIHDHARMDHTNTLAKVADDKTNKGQQSDEAAEKEDSKGNNPLRIRKHFPGKNNTRFRKRLISKRFELIQLMPRDPVALHV